MRDLLASLACVPGMRTAVLVTNDGVPVFTRGNSFAEAPQSGEVESLAALAVGWMDLLGRTVAPLSWTPARRVVLNCARATLVLQQATGAVLVVVLDPGASAEDLRLPMEATIVRLERHLRALASGDRPVSLSGSAPSAGPISAPPIAHAQHAQLPSAMSGGQTNPAPEPKAPIPPKPKGPGRSPADRYPGPTFRRR